MSARGEGGAGFKAPAIRSIVGMPAEVANDEPEMETAEVDMFGNTGVAAE